MKFGENQSAMRTVTARTLLLAAAAALAPSAWEGLDMVTVIEHLCAFVVMEQRQNQGRHRAFLMAAHRDPEFAERFRELTRHTIAGIAELLMARWGTGNSRGGSDHRWVVEVLSTRSRGMAAGGGVGSPDLLRMREKFEHSSRIFKS